MIGVNLRDRSGKTVTKTFPANPSGVTVGNLNISDAGFSEGNVLVTANVTDERGRSSAVFSGSSATLDVTLPDLVSIIAGKSEVGEVGLDAAGDYVLLHSREHITFTDINGPMKKIESPEADSADGIGETSSLIEALNRDLPFNSAPGGSGQTGTWGLDSNTAGAALSITEGQDSGWPSLYLTYENIGSSGFNSNILSEYYQFLIPNKNAVSVTITDLAGNRLSTEKAGSSVAVDFDDHTDVDVSDR
ncbi:hypothetical protein EVU96_12995 [Bacillus infantis]|uniref:hypothetical protein n=1 Tax=Bacillus infantis TaxID=324767 RepID=UPI00101C761A|nr:hypothetical protein [Bacillus infantis]RYI28840.1 hypothetical protein EVU96_12995 [Bacillus infantis]